MSSPVSGAQDCGLGCAAEAALSHPIGLAPHPNQDQPTPKLPGKRGRPPKAPGGGVKGKQAAPAAPAAPPPSASDVNVGLAPANQVALVAPNIVQPPRLRDCNQDYIDKCLKAVKHRDKDTQDRLRAAELDRLLTDAEKRAQLWRIVTVWDPPHNHWPKYGKASSFIRLSNTPHETPLQCFDAYFSDDFWATLVEETNRKLDSKTPPLLPVCRDELRAWFGMVVLIGLMPHPHLREYWSRQPHTAQPHLRMLFFGDIMSYQRFVDIKENLHAANNLADDGSDKLFKIRRLMELLRRNFKKFFRLGTNTALDEGLIPWKGVNPFRRKIPKPGGSTGFKVYILADSDLHYCYDFLIDIVRDATIIDHITPIVEPNLVPGQIVFCDRWYSTLEVVKWFASKRIGYVGTLKENCNPAKFLHLDAKAPRGSHVSCAHDGVCITRWNDESQCLFISTAVGIENVNYPRKAKHGPQAGQKVDQDCPLMAKKYNFMMGGVDRFDQMKAKYYSCCGKFYTEVWWKKLLMGLCDFGLVNSWLMYKHTHTHAAHFTFMRDVCDALIQPFLTQKVAQTAQKAGTPNLVRFKVQSAGGKRPQKHCSQCSTKKKRVRTCFGCAGCERPFCLDCFAVHKECPRKRENAKKPFPRYE